MKHPGLCLSVLASLSLAAAACGGNDARLTVVNRSDFVIEEIYLADVGDPSWGPNLLQDDALFPDERLILSVSCGFYDVLLIDEDGVDCQLHDIDLCLNSATWLIRNDTCTTFAQKALERKQQERATGASHDTTAPAPAP